MDDDGRIGPLPYDRAFVIQLGSQADVGGGPVVGRAEHIASGRSRRFASLDELLAFLASCSSPSRGS